MLTNDTQSCGCPDYTLSRRRLLGTASALGVGMATAQVFGDAFQEVAYGATPGSNVVVVLSLRGGADGLSMVVPRGVDHDLLSQARPQTVVPESSLLGSAAGFGLHPAFAPLLPMWEAGTFGAVHAVGQPAPNRSHFESMEIIEDAEPGSAARRGWLNRMIGVTSMQQGELGVAVGCNPTSLAGSADSLGFNQVSEVKLPTLVGRTQADRASSLQSVWQGQGPLGDAIRSTVATTVRLSGLPDTSVNAGAYPAGPLKDVLANTAALIRADVGTRAVTVDYGNWDMHSGMGRHDDGWMNRQVAHLAGSLKAFFADLGPAASRVTVVTMSEFGRRVKQNGSGGVDHGYGNAMLLLGAGVDGGRVGGRWPGLSSLTDGDLSVRQDFRSVLWEVISRRFPDVTGQRASIFPGFTPEAVGIMST